MKLSLKTDAFTLLEVMLAVMIFAIGVLGLLTALQTTVDAAGQINREAAIALAIQNQLTELEQGEFPGPGVESEGPDAMGVTYRREIEPLTLHNGRGQALQRMYRVRVIATWGTVSAEGEAPENFTAEVYVYRP